MLEDLDKGQKIFMIVMYVLTGISLLFGGFALYNLLTVEKPWTIGVAYATKIETNDLSVPIVNVKVYNNKNGVGKAVYDVQFNSYTDTENNGIAGFGIQCVGDYAVYNKSGIKENTTPTAWSFVADSNNIKAYNDYINKVQHLKVKRLKYSTIYGDFHLYYTGDNGVTYYTLPESKVEDFLLISIDGNNYKLTLKNYTYTYEDQNAWQEFWNLEGKKVEVTTQFTWYEVFQHIVNSAITNSGTTEFEEFSLSLLDLADYVEIKYMDDRGQYHPMPHTSANRTYLTIPVTYSSKGAMQATDSLFKQIASSPTWSYFDGAGVEDYWNAYADLTLTESNVNYVYNETESAYYVTIDETFSEYLQGLTNADIRLNIDLSTLDIDIYGINLKHFTFKINEFNVKTTNADFVIFNQSYCNVTPTLEVVA